MGMAQKDGIIDTVASMLDTIWTEIVIAFILPLPTFFLKEADYVWPGSICARSHRGSYQRQRSSRPETCDLIFPFDTFIQ